jgi:hypothetical protein
VSRNVTALHVSDDIAAAQQLRMQWERSVLDVPLILIRSPYRSFVEPVIAYLDSLEEFGTGYVTLVFSEYRSAWPWMRWLHNQSARHLREALATRPNTAMITIPYTPGTPRAMTYAAAR